MTNDIQEREITRYLISKKLNQALLSEIKDHFILQISDLMDADEMNFQEAFLQTKLNWQHELEMVKADPLSFKKITRIEKKILQTRFRNITLTGMASSLLLSSLLLINPDFFFYLEVLFLGVLVGMLGYNFIIKKMKFSDYIQLSFHPLVARNVLLIVILLSFMYLLNDEFNFKDLGIAKVFFLYAITTKIQLLYYNSRKINVLI
ncbi:hypothetical protein [Chryseobacterium soli]|uniref:hypothetical protein n=1 Tax=Chryseobacterium soli TaxID=445961 RepID=UPI00068B0C08|nr:hypothetical protein [Chryseobacterium soli]